jgi:hypothetical protein
MNSDNIIKGERYWIKISKLLKRNKQSTKEIADTERKWIELSKLLRSKTDEHKKSLSS